MSWCRSESAFQDAAGISCGWTTMMGAVTWDVGEPVRARRGTRSVIKRHVITFPDIDKRGLQSPGWQVDRQLECRDAACVR